jgi:hypothetical protein
MLIECRGVLDEMKSRVRGKRRGVVKMELRVVVIDFDFDFERLKSMLFADFGWVGSVIVEEKRGLLGGLR